MKIGFVGLGNMGSAMARNLLKAGHAVTVYNRTRARAEEFASIAASPAEAAAGEVVITMLADDHAVDDAAQELVKALQPGAIHVSMSTISPALSERMQQAHTQAGQGYIAAPVLGRPEAAAAAKLFILAAGPADALAACRPLFDALGQRTFILGENPPAANVVKLSCNFLLAAAIESLAEAFAWTRKAGIDPQVYLELLTSTLFTAPVYKTYGRLIAEEAYTPAGFKMPLGLKDVRLALAAAESSNVPLPMASLIHDHMVGALALGFENLDWSALGRIAALRAGLAPL
jgi:3-hydroxyisobutyrate dehydrogenase-like beta-hydroxyacid dehydrogenase